MLHRFKFVLILIFILNTSCKLLCQDTAYYQGFLSGILFESIALYPDNTFRWTSEYDLIWSEYGQYKLENNKLQLKFYSSLNDTTLSDTTIMISNPTKIENFIAEKEKLFRLNKSGRKIHRTKDKSIRTHWSWIFGHKYEIIKITVANSVYNQLLGIKSQVQSLWVALVYLDTESLC
jgi:hypothetical protein